MIFFEYRGCVAQWIRRLPTEQKILGLIPGMFKVNGRNVHLFNAEGVYGRINEEFSNKTLLFPFNVFISY